MKKARQREPKNKQAVIPTMFKAAPSAQVGKLPKYKGVILIAHET